MILQFSQVSKVFGSNTVAVDQVSCQVPRGQFCVIIGASGAGKSTLLRMVNGLITPTGGSITFDGVSIDRRSLPRVRRRVGMVHQQFNLVPRLSVLKNVLAGALPNVSTLKSLFGLFPRDMQRRACQLLEEVGLDQSQLYRRAVNLSGGQQQRVAIARAFMMEPTVVLADEPVASLDPKNSRMILQLLKDESREHGATVLCSLHQVDLAKEFADRVIGMRAGRIVFDGPPEQFHEAAQEKIYESQDDDPAADSIDDTDAGEENGYEENGNDENGNKVTAGEGDD